MHRKYIFVTGGVISGLGKGITTASIARLLQSRGYNTTAIKIDAYVNVDAGTMNPTEHGEVFVTEDGMETDQDIGNYERFLNRNIKSDNYLTTGSVYLSIIQRERNLEFDGKCVEVVPHVPMEVIRRIKKAAEKSNADITLIEIGGTVGEYQNILFLEAARIMKLENPKDVITLMVSYLPIPRHLGEMKTKPTQYASRTLNETGLQADFIVCRSHGEVDKPRRERIALLCNMHPDDIISNPDVESIYEMPVIFEEQELAEKILKKLELDPKQKDMKEWKELVNRIKTVSKIVKIGIVGKYFTVGNYMLSDVYISVIEALKHAGWNNNVKIEMDWIDSIEFEKNPKTVEKLKEYNGIVVPGGFGSRGIDGILNAIKYSRENKIPYLGLCYGMQLAVVEFARNVCKIEDAHTTEVKPDCKNPVIDLLPWQKEIIKKNEYGATMRLGGQDVKIKNNTLAYRLYEKEMVKERFRHRLEVSEKYIDILEKNGLIFSGSTMDNKIKQICEIQNNKFFLGTQFHPEFKSRPLNPHPIFNGFIKACITN